MIETFKQNYLKLSYADFWLCEKSLEYNYLVDEIR